MYRDLISKWVDEHKDEILNLNSSLVSVPSENRYPTGDEKKVQKLVADTLKEINCDVDVFLPTDVLGLIEHPAYLGERSYEDRPNVVGTKKGSGDGRSIIFSGHMDTVPTGTDPWSVDPYAGTVKDDKQYGLGIFDMKGGMAASMMALKSLQELGIELKGDVIIENVVDEEYGGANGTLACRLRGYEADIAIIPEPTNMVICPVNQGGSMFRITFQGEGAGRSFSGEELINPVFAGARFLDIFRQFEQQRTKQESTNRFYKDYQGLPTLVQGVKAGPVHLPLTDRVPSNCVIDVWIQCFPETTEEELHKEFISFVEERAKNDDILKQIPPKIEKLIRFLPGTGILEDHDIIDVTKAVSQDLGHNLPVKGAPFACDSFMFNLHSNTPALIWGPKGGNGHSPDEFIYVDDFMELVKMYALTIIKWCGVKE
jgi:acetylornithine deacetylase